jgi:WD40 repeat protein
MEIVTLIKYTKLQSHAAVFFITKKSLLGCSEQAWDIKGQRAVIIREVKEHKKAVTCFAISENGENLLSGSADKSIRVTNATTLLN